MKDRSTIIIIGGGIAGLATGCYAQMNGYQTRILEMHNLPGGLCTAWKRKGYTFDGCIHHLAGAGPTSRLHRMWQELGAVQNVDMVYHDALAQIETPDGKAFTAYTDPDRLKAHLNEMAPGDAGTIDEYTRAVRRFSRFEFFALAASKPLEMVPALPYIPAVIKWAKVTLEAYAQRFRDPFVRQAFPWMQYGFADVPAMLNLVFMAGCHNHHLGWPKGGSLPFARAIERRYRDLGGEITYRSHVTKILVETGAAGGGSRAVGVRLADGTEHRADVVISACDGHATIFDMLDGAFVDDQIKGYYSAPPETQPMNTHVSLGVSRDLSEAPNALTLLLAQPLTLMGGENERLHVEIHGSDSGMAPPGKTAIKVTLETSYARWRELYDDRARYTEEKQRIADAVIDPLERRFPGLKADIEVTDVATPVTVERFTGNWHGNQAWGIPGAGPMDMMRGLSKTLPGLDNFYMVGHWALAMIGITTVAIAARKLVEQLCRQDKRPFVTTIPATSNATEKQASQHN